MDDLQITPVKYVVHLLADSKGALVQLANLNTACPLAKSIAQLTRKASDAGITIYFQWIPSHVGILGNEEAEGLALAAHKDACPTIAIHKYNSARIIIHQELTKQHPAETAIGYPPFPIKKKKNQP